MTASPDSLAPQFRDDPKVEPPYSNAQISETAIHREIIRIYQNARRETREVYDLGHDPDRLEEDNWIIRWMLWHVFRYRDNRNRNRRATSPSEEPEGGGGQDSKPAISPSSSCKTSRKSMLAELKANQHLQPLVPCQPRLVTGTRFAIAES